MAEKLSNQSDRNQSLREKLNNSKNKGLALLGVIAMSMSACGGGKAGAEPTPEPTTTIQEATPTPSEVVTTPPAEVITEMPEIPTFRPDGQPWEGVDDTYAKIKASQDLIANADDSPQGQGIKIHETKNMMVNINKFVELNTGLDLYGTSENGMIDLLTVMNNPNDPEIIQGVAERYAATDHTMQGLYISSQPGSAGQIIAETWANYTFIDQEQAQSWLNSGNLSRESLQSDDTEIVADEIKLFYSPKRPIGATAFQEVGGPDSNYMVMKFGEINTYMHDDNTEIDDAFIDGYVHFVKIGIGAGTGEVQFHGYELSSPNFNQLTWVDDELFGKTIGEAKQIINEQD